MALPEAQLRQAVGEVLLRVRALQSPAQAPGASAWLAQFQRSEHAVGVCAVLLREALRENDAGAAFFAAHTLAECSRAPLDLAATDAARAEAAQFWARLADDVVGLLRASGAGESPEIQAPVLRQLCAATSRLTVWLVDEWPSGVSCLLSLPIGRSSSASPLIEALRALAEEPFDHRLPVDSGRRARCLLALRAKTPDVFAACAKAASSGGAYVGPALSASAVWLRAQPAYEEWLPMVAFGGAGGGATHPALQSFGELMPLTVQSASLAIDLPALLSSCEVFDAFLPLVADVSAQTARCTVAPLLAAFVAAYQRLPRPSSENDLSRWSEIIDVHSALFGVVHAAFKSALLLDADPVWPSGLKIGVRALADAGPSGPLAKYNDGALLGRALDAWEALGSAYNDSSSGMQDMCFPACMQQLGDSQKRANGSAAVVSAFASFLSALPTALTLPNTLQEMPVDWELPQLRSRASQILLVWCDNNSPCAELIIRATAEALANARLQDASSIHGAGWSSAEFALWLASVSGEIVAAAPGGEDGPPALPGPLAELLSGLASLPLFDGPSASRSALLCSAAAEFISSMDSWITPETCSVGSEAIASLMEFSFRLAGAPGAQSPTAEALIVIISNFAPVLVEDAERLKRVLWQLAVLCFGSTHSLHLQRRERLIKSALGPLLTRLPEERLIPAMEELAAPLRGAAPIGSGETSDAAMRLLFSVLAAPQPPDTELPLRWLIAHWPWFEAALDKWARSEAVVESATAALTVTLARARGSAPAAELLLRTVPLLGQAAALRGSAPALAALAQLVLVFRGGPTALAQEAFAQQIFCIADAVLCAGASRAAELPADFLSALLELFANALAPRCAGLVSVMLAQHVKISAAVTCVAQILPGLTNPRAVCWSLLMMARIPHWLQVSTVQSQACSVFGAVLPSMAAAWCQLIASSPVARDAEVVSALAKAMLASVRTSPESPVRSDVVQQALGQAMAASGQRADECELLLAQLGDSTMTEEVLAEQLIDTVDAWQARVSRSRLLHGSVT
eukprot:TRINITY_DN31981_c0_g1_i1.p1 TRINITY_DN31981_c0_g1~~TRINITY_DN31981_c0_g1_i1.p1  ORF type:complete len:1044 (-),score=189.08 TRINITY_DN31981_c0_g1_i1:81-3176(-)